MDISVFGKKNIDATANRLTLLLVHGESKVLVNGEFKEMYIVDIILTNDFGEIIYKKTASGANPETAEILSIKRLDDFGLYTKRYEIKNIKHSISKYGNDVEMEIYDKALPVGAVMLNDDTLTPFERR